MLASTYRPLLIAIMPWLVRSPAELSAVNVLATTIENSEALAGPVAVAALLAAGPTWLAVGVASGFLAAAALLLWPVRLCQQHPDPGHARGSLLAGTVRGLAEMARVAPPAGIAVLRQRRRHPHRRRPPRIPHRQGRLPQRTRIGCLERLSPLRTGRSGLAVSSDTRRRETRIFGDPSLGTPVGLRSAVGASHVITIRTRLSGRLSDAWPPAACRPRLFCAAWQRCICRRYSLGRMRAGPIRAAVHPGGGDEVGEQTAGMASRMSGTRTLARIRRTGPGTTGWRRGRWCSLNCGLGSARAAAGGWTPRGKGGRRSGLVAGTGPTAGAPCSSSRSQPCLAAGRHGDVGTGGRADWS
jgi:hypothetical protein